jgi:hypothetical protein
MSQNEAYILATELGGKPYCAGLYYWRVSVRIDKWTVRIYDSKTNFWEVYG